ncbi:DedA family protein [Leucobacter sp. OH1287]|uniref:DedA family protein n=1 Tax=Leucobacter sp. OH1287 TaxID=2491049 RepID=UPI000F5FBE33|nr:DedA family protein [Leucobacter sp. OH1287]RRD61890.1 DedA family protein [Leucobacter sp. OH1287]
MYLNPATVISSSSNWLDVFTDWIVGLMNAIGAPGVGIGIAIESIFPPIPSEVLLPLAGFTAAQPGGGFGPVSAIIWATIGSLVGALFLYWIGYTIDHDRTVKLFEKLPLVDGSDVTKTIAWFQKNGAKAVFFGRMLPLFRSLISIPAGIERMPLLKFVLLTTSGSLLWNTLWILAGYFLGENWEAVSHFIDTFKYLVIGIVVLLLGFWLFRKIRARRARAQQ